MDFSKIISGLAGLDCSGGFTGVFIVVAFGFLILFEPAGVHELVARLFGDLVLAWFGTIIPFLSVFRVRKCSVAEQSISQTSSLITGLCDLLWMAVVDAGLLIVTFDIGGSLLMALLNVPVYGRILTFLC